MITAIGSLVISLVVLYCVYLLLEWVLGFIAIVPAVFKTIVYVIFVTIAFVIVLNFLATLLGGAGYQFGGYKLK